MPETQYRQARPKTLLDAINDAASFGGQTAPGVATELSPGAQDALAAMREAAFAPDPEEPAPAKLGIGRRIGLGLANALNAYASAFGAGQNRDYLNEALGTIEGQRQEAIGRGRATSERKRDRARYELGREEARIAGETSTRAQAETLKEQRAYNKTLAENTRANQLADAEASRAFQVQQADLARKAEIEKEGIKQKHEAAMVRLRASLDKGDSKSTAADKKAMSEAMSEIGDLADKLPEMLASGVVTPDKVNSMIRRKVDALLLGPEAADVVMTYAARELGPILQHHEANQMNTELDAGSPQQPNTRFNPYINLGRKLGLGQ